VHQEVDTQGLELHRELVAILELGHLQVQGVIQVQEPHLVLGDILGVNLELQVVDILEQEHQVSLELQEVDILEQEHQVSLELQVVDILEQGHLVDSQEVGILELVHLVVGIRVLELPQVNTEVPLHNKWIPRLLSGFKQWIRITVVRLMPRSWARPWQMGT